MAYVPVPKDLSKVKTKIAFNLTKRQLIFFGIAVMIGLPVFFVVKNLAGTNIATYSMIFIMIPCFLFAMYEKHGQPLEAVLMQIIRLHFIKNPIRPYRTESITKRKKRKKTKEAKTNGRQSKIAKADTRRTKAAAQSHSKIHK